jgi:hypothetical protein
MAGEVLFEAEGSRGSSASASSFVVVIGVIGSLAMLVPGFVAPQMVGPWWIYAATLIASIVFAVHTFRQDKVIVRLLPDGAGARLDISGPAVKLDVALAGAVNHWISFVKGPHVGAKKLVQYNAVIDAGGRKLGFWNLCGAEGSEPADWPVQSSGVSGCDEQFLCPRLAELVRLIQQYPSGLR